MEPDVAFKVNLNIPYDLRLKEEPLFLKQWVENVSELITWKDIEICMNNPILYNLELIDPNNVKLPYDKQFLAREKHFLFDSFHNHHGMVITEYGNYNEKTKALLNHFEETFDVDAAIHVYCGLSSKATSFKIHCDAPNNFIIQVEGKCHWKIYNERMSNLIDFSVSHPRHIEEKDLTIAIDEVLSPGDGVLIPPRQYHVALPIDRRISLSIPCWPRSRDSSTRFDRKTYRINR
jgi:ribosomal protein L16 Arg81 hydroxylase